VVVRPVGQAVAGLAALVECVHDVLVGQRLQSAVDSGLLDLRDPLLNRFVDVPDAQVTRGGEQRLDDQALGHGPAAAVGADLTADRVEPVPHVSHRRASIPAT
jgi:hypothetical protein